jgi:hypothetical protein
MPPSAFEGVLKNALRSFKGILQNTSERSLAFWKVPPKTFCVRVFTSIFKNALNSLWRHFCHFWRHFKMPRIFSHVVVTVAGWRRPQATSLRGQRKAWRWRLLISTTSSRWSGLLLPWMEPRQIEISQVRQNNWGLDSGEASRKADIVSFRPQSAGHGSCFTFVR